MKRAALFQKTAYIAIGLALAALIGINLYQRHLLKQIPGDTSPTTSVGTEAKPEAAPGIGTTPRTASDPATGDKQVDELNYQLGAAEEELDMAQKQLADETAQKAEFAKNAVEIQKKMLADPAQRKIMRTSMKASLEAMYGALYKKLGLSGEKLDQFQELLTDQLMAATELGMEMLDSSLPKEKQEALKQHQKSLETEYDTKAFDLLGESGAAAYATYKDTLSERMVLSSVSESLGLAEADQEALIDAMRAERKTVETALSFDSRSISSPADLDAAGMARILEVTDRTFEGYMKTAKAHLSEAQAAQFKAHLDQQRQLQETSLKMVNQMFGSNSSSQ